MSKPHSEALFGLIKSLSTSEKRCFKIFSSRHVIGEENQYVRLFDMVDKQPHYDEKKILQKTAIATQQLRKRKKYLYELILRSLDIYDLEGDAENKINKIVRHTKILFKRGFYEPCLKLLIKAKRLATKYEKYLLISEILLFEETILRRMYDTKNLEKYIDKGFYEGKQALEKMIIINEYRKLYSQIYLLSNKEWVSRSPKDKKRFDAIVSHPLMKDERLANSYEARVWYYYTRTAYFSHTRKMENAYHIIRKRIAFIEQHPHQIIENPMDYISALHNHVFICTILGKNEEFMNILEKLRTIPIKTFNLHNKIFASTYQLELAHYIKNGEFQKGIALMDEIKKRVEQFGDKLDKHFKLQLHYNISVLYFATEDSHTALKWLNIILNNPEKGLRKDIFCFAQILNLIIHFELGNHDFLESAVKSANHFLDKRNRLFVLEKSVLEFFRQKLPNANTPAQRREAFKELRKEILKITKDDFEKKALDYFDIISWLESKIKNRPFAEIVREKAGRT